jgi:uncharacterized MnhB-related membrane protein
MIWELNLLLGPLAFVVALLALEVKDLLGAVVLLGVFSLFMCLIWAELGTPDVAFTEAAVGAGVSTAFFVATVFKTTRRSKD